MIEPYDVHRLYEFVRVNNVIDVKKYEFWRVAHYALPKSSVEFLTYLAWQWGNKFLEEDLDKLIKRSKEELKDNPLADKITPWKLKYALDDSFDPAPETVYLKRKITSAASRRPRKNVG